MSRKKYFKIMFVGVYLLFIPLSVPAEDLIRNNDVRAVCEQVIGDIYQEILAQKPDHPELSDFTEADAQWKNNFDLKSIIYRSSSVKAADGVTDYGFQLTILPTKEVLRLPEGYRAFNFSFPVLDLKFTGYQNVGLAKNLYDVQQAIQKYGIKLWDEQQKYLPYKLSLKTAKETYRVGEDIEFIVKLTNDSKVNYKMKKLDAKTLYFVFDNKPWGAEELDAQDQKKLLETLIKPGQTIEKKFHAPGFRKPQTVEVYVTYNFPYKEVKPTAKLIFQVTN